jgi:hypothetical protein
MYEPLSGDLPPDAYENHGGRTVAVLTVCSFVVTVVVCLRFYVRLVIVRKFGADDWVLAAALVCFLRPLLSYSPDNHLLGRNPSHSYAASSG